MSRHRTGESPILTTMTGSSGFGLCRRRRAHGWWAKAVTGTVIAVLCLCSRKPAGVSRTFFRMGFAVRVTLVEEPQSEGLWARVDSLLLDWDRRFSGSGEFSEVLRVNMRESEGVAVSPELFEMVRTGVAYGDPLEGWFDITILPIKEAWGFGDGDTALTIPDSERLERLLRMVDRRLVHVDSGGSLSLRFDSASTRIDIGGIAKGFVIRALGSLLHGEGEEDFLIEAGGDIFVSGRRAGGGPWRIGIRHPRRRGLLAVIRLDSGSVVTSGDYEQYYLHADQRIHHIFDPRTGRSCNENRSVTIASPDPADADILSTGLFCLPADSIVSFVEARPRLECLVVDGEGGVWASEAWRGSLDIVDSTARVSW